MSARRVVMMAAAVLTGCGSPEVQKASPPAATRPRLFAAPSGLRAGLRGPLQIDLQWKDEAIHEAGYFVEGYYVGHAPASTDFTIIEVLPADATSFSHEKLLPETRFVYRVRPFFGAASNVAEVKTGGKGSPQMQAPAPGPAPPEALQVSLRSPDAGTLAAPADLRATLLPPLGVRLEWKDHARDEDQYLIEIRSETSAGFRVASFEPPDTRVWTSYDFDPETRFAFRVRAFVYGEPSNVVEATTGRDSSMGSGDWKRVE